MNIPGFSRKQLHFQGKSREYKRTSPWSRPIQMSTLPPVQDENTTLVNVTAVVTNIHNNLMG